MVSQPTKYKTIRHFHQPGDVHELTFSCYKRWPLLERFDFYRFLGEGIETALERHAMALSAFVFMPEHVHLLVWPRDSRNAPISNFLKTLKLSCSTRAKRWLNEVRPEWIERLTVRERPGKHCFRFWQEGPGYDRNLTTPQAVESSLEYLHLNPVRRGLVPRSVDWPWSSARDYEMGGGAPRDVPPTVTPLPTEFWD